jgi:hypothetical protein
MTTPSPLIPEAEIEAMRSEDFDALDDILDDLRTRYDETPQWEFCEGFMAALICCRRPIPPAEYLPVLLGLDDDDTAEAGGEQDPAGSFADEAQHGRFMALWAKRWERGGRGAEHPDRAARRRARLRARGDGRSRRRGQPVRGRARRARRRRPAGLRAGLGPGIHVRGGELARGMGGRRATRRSPGSTTKHWTPLSP